MSEELKYRKKPVVIEAMQFRAPEEAIRNVDRAVAFDDWIEAHKGNRRCFYRGSNFIIETLEGDMTASPGDYIICGVQGELYPCKPDIFAATHEPTRTPTQETQCLKALVENGNSAIDTNKRLVLEIDRLKRQVEVLRGGLEEVAYASHTVTEADCAAAAKDTLASADKIAEE